MRLRVWIVIGIGFAVATCDRQPPPAAPTINEGVPVAQDDNLANGVITNESAANGN